ncbi:transporter substrate-binding protein [Bradyrhizobium sp. USDA 3650]
MPKRASSVLRRALLMAVLLLFGLRAAAADEAIPIGVLHSITGVTAADEAHLKDFVFFLVKEQNEKGGVLGKKLRAIAPDAQSTPMVFNLRAAELITSEKVSVIFGGWGRASLFAMAPLFKGSDAILFYPANILSLDSLPQERSIFYAGFFPEQLAKAAITYMNSSVSPSLWVLLGNESSEAGAMNAMMRSILTKARGVQDADVLSRNVRTPELARAASDIASFAQSRRSMTGPTAVLTTLQGLGDIAISGDPRDRTTDLNRFPILSLTLRESQLPTSSKGQLGIVDYYQGVATRANTELLRRWRAYTNNPNSSVDDAMASYAAAFAMWVQAVEKARTVEAAKVIDALPGITVETLAGNISAMLPDHRITKQARVVRVNDVGKFELVWSENDGKRSTPTGGSSFPSQPVAPPSSAPLTPPVANLPAPRTPPGRASIEQTQTGHRRRR